MRFSDWLDSFLCAVLALYFWFEGHHAAAGCLFFWAFIQVPPRDEVKSRKDTEKFLRQFDARPSFWRRAAGILLLPFGLGVLGVALFLGLNPIEGIVWEFVKGVSIGLFVSLGLAFIRIGWVLFHNMSLVEEFRARTQS